MIKRKSKKESIDAYLDIYNDYKTLYEMFGDFIYKDIMEMCIDNIEGILRRD